MAECRKQTMRAEPVVTYPPVTTEFVLRLNEDEAGTLKQLLSRIGGNPDGPRGDVDKISAALFEAGVAKTSHKLEIHYGGVIGTPYLCIGKGD